MVLAHLTEFCRRAARAGLDTLLPPVCLSCEEIVEEPGALCASCWPKQRFVAAPLCERCGVPLPIDHEGEATCGACLARAPRYDRARSVLVYDEASRHLVLPFKHGDRTDMAPAYGRWMARAGAELLVDADLVAPVPLHWRRLVVRRYNQAALLAAACARQAGRRYAPDLLRRMRWTGSQAGLGGRARRTNVRRAFEIGGSWAEIVRGARVVLVDDVLTTGATVEACARCLRAAGARRVDVLTLARVVRPGL
ncbi:MAG: ComF family protein [Alphaproteobacteria bacterium]|nr:ComF family protein [Alphaproteobacteria bacterium]